MNSSPKHVHHKHCLHSSRMSQADRELLRGLLDSTTEAVIAANQSGIIVEWNRGAQKIFGLPRAAALESPLWEILVAPQRRGNFEQGFREFVCGEATPSACETFEFTAVDQKGREFSATAKATCIKTTNGPTVALSVQDISHVEELEREVARRTLESRLLHQTGTLTTEEASFEDALQQCVNTLCEFTGWPVGHVYIPDEADEELISTGIWYMADPTSYFEFRVASERQRFRRGEGLPGRIWQTEETRWVANIHEDPNFQRRSIRARTSAIGAFGFPVISRDEVVAILEFFTDHEVAPGPQLLLMVRAMSHQLGRVLDHRRWEDQRVRLAAIVDSSLDAIIAVSPDGIITHWNAGATRIFGYGPEIAVGRKFVELLSGITQSAADHLLRIVERGEKLDQFETDCQREDGQAITVSLTVSPLQANRTRRIGSTIIARDMSRRKRAEQELAEARTAAELAGQAKSEFLANVSHELRTPMNAIIGMTDLALATPLPDTIRDYLQISRESAGALLVLLDDLLNFSRLEAGRFELELDPFPVRDTIDEAVRSMASRGHAKGLEVVTFIHADVPEVLHGDALRLRQIIVNLTSNAIKFTEQGEVVVEVKLAESKQTQSLRDRRQFVSLHLVVRDTGIGISPDNQQRIFAPFTQADASTTRRFAGTGLGLAICRELTRLMDGRMWVESQLHQGSRFHVVLKFGLNVDIPSSVSPPKAAFDSIHGKQVLVVDDHESAGRAVGDYLSQMGMKPRLATSAEMALTMAEAVDFPLILIDALMPQTDGPALVKQLRGRNLAHCPVVMMISSADRSLLADTSAENLISLAKPVSHAGLRRAVAEALHLDPSTRLVGRSALATAERPLNILIAEDTPANQKAFQAILRNRGHSFVTAHNGREAVELLSRNSVDVVLMDVQMPTMDGLQATAAIRKLDDVRLSRIPIVAMTAHAMRRDKQRCLAAGMNAYLSKPVDADKLVQTVEHAAANGNSKSDRVSGQFPTATAVEQESPHPSPSPARESRDTPTTFDPIRSLKRLGGDRQLFADMVSFFEADVPELLRQIQESLESGNSSNAKRAAHALKGLAAGFDAHQAVDVARRIEEFASKGKLGRARMTLPQLQADVMLLLTELREYLSLSKDT